jgi:hypothetical protein
MNATESHYRLPSLHRSVVGFSVSYEPTNLLERGLGLEHVRELILRLARPLLRYSASLAYAGNWEDTPENFTYILLRLISAEQEDGSFGGPNTNSSVGLLYNHSAWPHYLKITRRTEAQWIDACRIIRVTQEDAGIPRSMIATEADLANGTPRAILNAAITLSAMRRLMMKPMEIKIPGAAEPEQIPPVKSRILLGGRLERFSGFLPGLFEEALVSFESKQPLYILGGFGGAAEVLARAILDDGGGRPEQFTTAWLSKRNPNLANLLAIAKKSKLPPGARTTAKALSDLFTHIKRARTKPHEFLRTGLELVETRELMLTQDPVAAVRLVRKGLAWNGKLPPLAA